MEIGSLGCKRATIQEEKEILKVLNATPSSYKIDNIEKDFNNLLEVYKFCKKEIVNPDSYISSNLCTWVR